MVENTQEKKRKQERGKALYKCETERAAKKERQRTDKKRTETKGWAREKKERTYARTYKAKDPERQTEKQVDRHADGHVGVRTGS